MLVGWGERLPWTIIPSVRLFVTDGGLTRHSISQFCSGDHFVRCDCHWRRIGRLLQVLLGFSREKRFMTTGTSSWGDVPERGPLTSGSCCVWWWYGFYSLYFSRLSDIEGPTKAPGSDHLRNRPEQLSEEGPDNPSSDKVASHEVMRMTRTPKTPKSYAKFSWHVLIGTHTIVEGRVVIPIFLGANVLDGLELHSGPEIHKIPSTVIFARYCRLRFGWHSKK